MTKYLMGMDYGTGGGKVVIINDQAEVIAYSFREYKIFTDQPGWSEHDPINYWVIACEMIKECIKKADINPKDIKGFANSSALPSMVMVDENNDPVNMAYNLMDRRAIEEVKWVIENIGAKRVFDINGNRLEDHSNLINLMWEKKNRPDSYKRIAKVLTIDGFIRLKMVGKATANFSSGAFFGVAYDIRKNEFNRQLMDKIGISLDLMPEFHSCEEIVGYVTPKAAEETGLPVGLPVAAGSVDCNAGWVGGGAVDVGDIQINLGTCGVMGVIHKDPGMINNTMINCSYTTDSRNVFATIAATTTGGQTFRYLRDNFSQLEIAMEQLIPSISAYDYLEKEAGTVTPGSEGLIVLPYLMGERTPIWDASARGVIFGLSLNHGKKHLIRAMLESVAYALYDSYLIFKESASKINLPIVLNEGGAKNKLWRQIITDVFNEPTVFVKNRAGAPMGDAILAGVATGVFPDFSVAKHKAEYIEPLEPIKANHEMYMDYFEIYNNLYSHLKDDYQDLAKLRSKYL